MTVKTTPLRKEPAERSRISRPQHRRWPYMKPKVSLKPTRREGGNVFLIQPLAG